MMNVLYLTSKLVKCLKTINIKGVQKKTKILPADSLLSTFKNIDLKLKL